MRHSYLLTALIAPLILMGCGANGTEKPSASTATTSLNQRAPEWSPLLAVITTNGGLCASGSGGGEARVCNTSTVIKSDGEVSGKASKVDVAKLQQLIETADYNSMKSKPFKGTCPTAYDGTEVVYKFYSNAGVQTLSTCVYDIDFNDPLFKELTRITK